MKNIKLLVPFLFIFSFSLFSCNKEKFYKEYNFKYWNNCESISKLKEFVCDSVTPSNKVDNDNRNLYVPAKDRIVVFDMDGTLYGERAPIYGEWLLYNYYYDKLSETDERKTNPVLVPNESKLTGKDVPEYIEVYPYQIYEGVCEFSETRVAPDVVHSEDGKQIVSLEYGEAYLGAQLFSDISLNNYLSLVDEFLDRNTPSFNNLKYNQMFYKPMIEVIEFLKQNDYTIYVVSGTDRWMVRQIMSYSGASISINNVIGMDVSLYSDDDKVIYRGDRLLSKNVKEAKVESITREIGQHPILSFGNSSGDVNMNRLALNNPKYHPLATMIVADDLEREYGYTSEELSKRTAGWEIYNQVSMKNDWKTIYGDNVTKIN